MIKVFSLAVIIIVCSSCSKNTEKVVGNSTRILVSDSLSLEYKALDLFLDSIWNKTKYFESPYDDFILSIPRDYDSSWVEKGIFNNWVIFTDGIIDSISNPYYSNYEIQFHSDFFENENKLNEAKEFYKDYERLVSENNPSIDTININAPMVRISFEEFIKMDSASSGFLKIGRHLKSNNGYQIQLEVVNTELREPVFFEDQLTTYQFYVFFDKEGNITDWTIK